MIDPQIGSAIIGAVQAVFALALFPTIARYDAQVPRATSSITAAGLTVIAGVYVLMNLWLAALCAGVTALCWWFVCAFRPVRP